MFLALRKAFVTEVSAMLGERALYQSPVMLPVYEHPTPEGGEEAAPPEGREQLQLPPKTNF